MQRIKPIPADALFHGLSRAMRTLGPTPVPRSMHHSNGTQQAELPWDDVKLDSVFVSRGEEVYHLQVQLETNPTGTRKRVVILGRRQTPRNNASDNTQRATFNSDNWDPHLGHWLRPQILKKNPAQRHAFETLLPSPALPFWDGNRFVLGTGKPSALLSRYLLVLRVIEKIKSQPYQEVVADYPDSPEVSSAELPRFRLFLEGKLKKVTRLERQRCAQLRSQVAAFHRLRSDDGRLHCAACSWAPTVPVRGEVIEIHHCPGLARYPKAGRVLTWTEALKELRPLCPNCHRTLESHPNGGRYSVDELRTLLNA